MGIFLLLKPELCKCYKQGEVVCLTGNCIEFISCGFVHCIIDCLVEAIGVCMCMYIVIEVHVLLSNNYVKKQFWKNPS